MLNVKVFEEGNPISGLKDLDKEQIVNSLKLKNKPQHIGLTQAALSKDWQRSERKMFRPSKLNAKTIM